MDDVYRLQAATEATLVAALGSWLRDADGWVVQGPHHALVPLPQMIEVDATYDGAGNVVTPPVWSTSWHLNIKVRRDHPDHDALVAALTPYVITPTIPRFGFAS